jgi:hypothetical protein
MDKNMQDIIDGLINEMDAMPVVDSHEHLPPEAEAISHKADVFTRIYCHYSITNVVSAGMKYDRFKLKDTQIPLEERWQAFRPFLESIKNTGYARAAQIVARDLYGIEDINDDTYMILSERLQEANKPGLYNRILKDKCKINRILNQGNWNDARDSIDRYSIPVYRGFLDLYKINDVQLRKICDELEVRYGGDFNNADEFIDYWMETVINDGHAGLKFSASTPADCIDDKSARPIFKKMQVQTINRQEIYSLCVWLMHKAIEKSTQYNLTVAIHCGLNWCCWDDFRQLNPLNVIPLTIKYRNTVFDLYHAGIPWVREMAVIGNQYPNVNLNLVWTHQISPYMAEQMLNEWLDLVPINKIIGFGGDNCDGPEKTYGVLKMAKENIARALAVRISRKQLTESRAVDICKAWLYDNPRRIYNI